MSKFPCRRCKKVYKTRKGNFYKKAQSKSGWDYDCITCNREQTNDWLSRQTPEKIIELRAKEKERIAKHKQTAKFKQTVENYKERRKVLRNFRNWQKRTEERLPNYVTKFYWEEKQHFFLLDIKQDEW